MYEWAKFQRQWIYLENIFSNSDLKRSLINELRDWERINGAYKEASKKVNSTPQISVLTKINWFEKQLKNFKRDNAMLNELNKKINNYLDTKRQSAPRFYFISNDELILILAHSEHHTTIQSIVSKIFENIDKLDFGGDDRSIIIFKLKSRESEFVELRKTITIKPDPVDKWITALENQMQETMFKLLKEGMKSFYAHEEDPEYKREWFKSNNSQVVMVVSQIHWSMLTNYMLEQLEEDANALFNWYEGMSKNLNILIDLVRSGMALVPH